MHPCLPPPPQGAVLLPCLRSRAENLKQTHGLQIWLCHEPAARSPGLSSPTKGQP